MKMLILVAAIALSGCATGDSERVRSEIMTADQVAVAACKVLVQDATIPNTDPRKRACRARLNLPF